MKGKLVLLDGYSLANRAFFALPPLTNSTGQPTNAVYGVAMMLLRLVEEEKPDYLAVAFDAGKPTFRHVSYDAYKAGRRPMADELRSQIPLVRRLFESMGIPVYEQPGFEADDLLGTMACRGEKEGLDVVIVTGDRDAFQLVSPKVRVLYTKRGITDVERIGPDELFVKYGLRPDQMIELKGLMGDASDNIPGVPGIGEKTALKLLHQFGDIPTLLGRLGEVERAKEQKLLEAYREQALQSRELATIRCDVEFPLSWEDCQWAGPPAETLRPFLMEMEFHQLLKRIGGEAGAAEPKTTLAAFALPETITYTSDEAEALLEALGRGPVAVLPMAQRVKRGDLFLRGLAFAAAGSAAHLLQTDDGRIPEPVIRWLAEKEQPKIVYDSKFIYRVGTYGGRGVQGIVEDLRLAGHLLLAVGSDLPLEKMVETYLRLEGMPVCRNERGQTLSWEALPEAFPWEKISEAGAAAAYAAAMLVQPLDEQLTAQGLKRLYREVELPLAGTLFRMEEHGIAVNPERLHDLGARFGRQMAELEQEIYTLAGETFNIGSPKQLGVILFERLGLPTGKKTKSGYSTDAEVLEELAEKHPVARKILDYRTVAKLNSTYVEALLQLADPATGRVHTTFQQSVTATGRLSSTDPNLQNIPVRTAEGREIRQVFQPTAGWTLLSADYSQIELRVMAHYSRDARYMAAFVEGDDIHRRTAAEIFGVPLDDVSRELRDRAKAVNFGILYGISGFGLAKGTGVSRKEADSYIERYFQRYEGVKKYLDQVIEAAREDGYVATLFGRRRYLPDLRSSNFMRRSFAERTARNTPIQGTAADIIKEAMLDVEARLAKEKLPARLLLQVHDELVLEADPEALNEVAWAVKEAMEHAVELAVPLTVEVKTGPTWGEMEKWSPEAKNHA